MIRRIILFLWILFVWFFAYRRYNKTAADNLLYKIKNLSFSSSNNYTTSVYNSTGFKESTSSWQVWSLLEKISDTIVDKTWNYDNETNEKIVQKILNENTLQQGVIVPWISGRVIVQTGKVDTISAQKTIVEKNNIITKPKTVLSDEDIKQAEEFSNLFSN